MFDYDHCPIDDKSCIACSIYTGRYNPPGGILYASDGFIIHQDPLVAIPGFLIISPKRHIYSIDEMTPLERNRLGHMIALAEQAIKSTTKVNYISVIQEDHSRKGHLHIWLFPWHDFIVKEYDVSLSSMRSIINHYQKDMQYRDETNDVLLALKDYFSHHEKGEEKHDFSHLDLQGLIFSDKDFRHANFQGAIMKNCKFYNCNLSYANFDDADLYRATFPGSTLYAATFRDADLTRADFRNSFLYGVKIFGADLSHTVFDKIVPEERNHEYDKAEDIYNTIKRGFSENGNKEESAEYYYKQCVANRKQKKGIIRLIEWAIADLVIGYGENIGRWLAICLIVMFLFACTFFTYAGFIDLPGAILSSISVFFGFNPVDSIAAIQNMDYLFLSEQLIGYFLIALGLIVVARKIVRD